MDVLLSFEQPDGGYQERLAGEAFSFDGEGRLCRRWLVADSQIRYDTVGRFKDGHFLPRSDQGHFSRVRLRAGEGLLTAVVGGDLLEELVVLSFEMHKNGRLAAYDQDDEHVAYVNNRGDWEAVSGWHVPGPEILVRPAASLGLASLRLGNRSRPSDLAEEER